MMVINHKVEFSVPLEHAQIIFGYVNSKIIRESTAFWKYNIISPKSEIFTSYKITIIWINVYSIYATNFKANLVTWLQYTVQQESLAGETLVSLLFLTVCRGKLLQMNRFSQKVVVMSTNMGDFMPNFPTVQYCKADVIMHSYL